MRNRSLRIKDKRIIVRRRQAGVKDARDERSESLFFDTSIDEFAHLRESGFQLLIDDGRFFFSQIDDPFLHSFVLVLLMLATVAPQRRSVSAVAALPVLDAAFRVHQLDVLLQPCLEVKLDATERTIHLRKKFTNEA